MNFLGGALEVGSLGLLNEDMMAGIPLVGSLTQSMPDEYKELLAMQRKLAEDAKLQRDRSRRAGLNAMGQSLLAFNPRNQVMAQMFGPEAAFTPDQFAAMAADPFGGPEPDAAQPQIDGGYLKDVFENGGKLPGPPPTSAPMIDPGYLARKEQWAEEEKRRIARLRAGIAPVPAGPPVIGGPAPMARRRG